MTRGVGEGRLFEGGNCVKYFVKGERLFEGGNYSKDGNYSKKYTISGEL